MPHDTARDLARQFADGVRSAVAIADAALARADAVAELNAFTWLDRDRVLSDAESLDRRLAAGGALGPLAGVPIVIKDNIDTIGYPTSAATPALRDHRPTRDATVARRLLDAGALLIGKTNMHELAIGGTSSNPVTGAVGNPHAPARIAGGSSGGTAAAIAAGIARVGLGTDTAGSARIPSAFCGTVGLRPSTGRYPADGVVPISVLLDTAGPMAGCVGDLDVIDAVVMARPPAASKAVADYRIGVPDRFYWDDLEPDVERVARVALDRLAAAGAVLLPVNVGSYIGEANALFSAMLGDAVPGDLAAFLAWRPGAPSIEEVISQIGSRDTAALVALARASDRGDRTVLVARRVAAAAAYEAVLARDRLDAIVYPTEAFVAPLIAPGGDSIEDVVMLGGKPVPKVNALIRNTCPSCALGAPSLSLPAGFSADGLPVGLCLDGRVGGDVTLIGLALAVETALAP